MCQRIQDAGEGKESWRRCRPLLQELKTGGDSSMVGIIVWTLEKRYKGQIWTLIKSLELVLKNEECAGLGMKFSWQSTYLASIKSPVQAPALHEPSVEAPTWTPEVEARALEEVGVQSLLCETVSQKHTRE